jgi:hypothetical protein
MGSGAAVPGVSGLSAFWFAESGLELAGVVMANAERFLAVRRYGVWPPAEIALFHNICKFRAKPEGGSFSWECSGIQRIRGDMRRLMRPKQCQSFGTPPIHFHLPGSFPWK